MPLLQSTPCQYSSPEKTLKMDLPPPPPAFDPREPAPITSSGSPAHPVNFGSSSSSRSGARSPPLVVGDRSTFRRASATAGGPGSRSVSSPPSPRQQAHSPSSRRSPPPMSSSGNTPSRSFGSSSSAAAASASHYGASSASHIHHAQPSPSDSDPRIFERDVEEPLNAGPTASASSGDHHAHPHAHAHDSSDGKVPTVLDDAVEALASVSMSAGSSGLYGIEVEAPVPSRVLQHQQPQRATSPQPPSFGSLSPKPSGVFVSSIAPTRDLSRSPSPTQATSAAVNTTNTSASSPSSRRPDFGTRLSSAISIAPALPGAFPADSTTPWIEATSGSKSGQAASMSDVGGEGDVFAAPPGGSSTASTRSWRKKIDDWVGPKPAALLSEEEARAEAAKRVSRGSFHDEGLLR